MCPQHWLLAGQLDGIKRVWGGGHVTVDFLTRNGKHVFVFNIMIYLMCYWGWPQWKWQIHLVETLLCPHTQTPKLGSGRVGQIFFFFWKHSREVWGRTSVFVKGEDWWANGFFSAFFLQIDHPLRSQPPVARFIILLRNQWHLHFKTSTTALSALKEDRKELKIACKLTPYCNFSTSYYKFLIAHLNVKQLKLTEMNYFLVWNFNFNFFNDISKGRGLN